LNSNYKNKNNFLIGNMQQKISENYGTKMMDIIQEIDKQFYNVYRNNKEMMKKYFEKNEDELKLRYALEHIKKDYIILITLLKIIRLVY
jgi:hypothetical protein